MPSITSHPTYLRTLKLLDSTAGRDKLMRIVQYFARFLSYYLFRTGYSKVALDQVKTLQANMALSRKLFRVGKPLTNARAAVTAYGNKTADPVLRTTAIIRNLGYAGYLSLDSLVWLHAAKIRPFSPERFGTFQRTGYKLWLTALISGIVSSLYRVRVADKTIEALQAEEEKDTASLKRVAAEKQAALTQLIWDALDTTIPLTALKYANLDDGFVGLAGLITSVIGLRQLW